MARLLTAGLNGDVRFPYAERYRIQGDLAIGMWVKIGSPAASGGIVLFGGDGALQNRNRSYLLHVRTGFNIRYIHNYGVVQQEINEFATALSGGVWHYIGLTRDFSAKTVKFWKGTGTSITFVSTFNYTNQPDGGNDASNRLVWFSDHDLNPSFGGSAIYNPTIHNRQLTQEEHFAQMQGHLFTDNLQFWSPFEGTHSPEPDLSGSGNTGTVHANMTSIVDNAPIVNPLERSANPFLFADPSAVGNLERAALDDLDTWGSAIALGGLSGETRAVSDNLNA